MQVGVIQGATRIVGRSQGYNGLPIRDELIHCTVNGPETPAMITAWIPTPAELAALNAGAAVHVRILEIGRAHVCTPVTHAQHVCRLLLENKKPLHSQQRT